MRKIVIKTLIHFLVLGLTNNYAQAQGSGNFKQSTEEQAILATYRSNHIPLRFEENISQYDDPVFFKANDVQAPHFFMSNEVRTVIKEKGNDRYNSKDCCEKRGGIIDKPTKLIFTYTGGGCTFNNINASEGKHLCINSTTVNGPQFISILAEGQLIGGARTINEGDLVEIYVKNGGGNSFGNELQVKIGRQIVEIHTSCSDALVSGENYGALRLEAVNGENGVTCGTIPPSCSLTGGIIVGNQSGCVISSTFNPSILTNMQAASFSGSCNTNPPSSGNCCEEHGDHNHLQKIALKYVGSGSTTIRAYADKDGATLLYAGTTNPGDIILLDASNTRGSKYNDRFDSGAKMQVGRTTFELHSSCSQPTDAGMGISTSGDFITNPTPNASNILFIIEGLSTPDGCSEGSFNITDTPTNEEEINYQWQYQLSNEPWADIAEATGLTYDPPATSQTIKYRRIATNCCGNAISNEVTIAIISETVPVTISKSNDLTCSVLSTTLTANPAGQSYKWSNGSTNRTITVNTSGSYVVTVTNTVSGCTSTKNVNIPLVENCQEICGNGKDDDNDNQIDCADEDCNCTCESTISGIPTPAIYNDNNTPEDLTDDTYSFQLTVNGQGSGWIGGGKTDNYEVLTNFGPYAVGEAASFKVRDAENSSCFFSVSVNMSACIYLETCTCCVR